MRVHVIGTGVIGRLVARACVERGWQVGCTDDGSPRASAVAAGLLSPLAGRERPSPTLIERARRSLERWPAILRDTNVAVERRGSVALALDGAELDDLQRMLARTTHRAARLDRAALRALEPELDFSTALYLANEGWIDAQAALEALPSATADRDDVTNDWRRLADVTIDCRGLGAREILPLRGVRGELLVVHAPDVRLTRPVRLVGRDPVYVVPRAGARYVIGATCVESDACDAISVGAVLELLSAACAIHPGFREARVLEQRVGVRPALPDHEPCLRWRGRTLHVNGLFRHGFVIGPALADEAVEEVRRCASS